MFRDFQLHFFQEKISDLNTAVFYNQSTSVLKIPNNIINVLHVDDVGQLWFFLKPPRQHINQFEQKFFARLDFLRKGRDYFLKVEGKAYLVTDPEEINELVDFPEEVKEKARRQEILVKMKIDNIAYYEKTRKVANDWMEIARSNVSALLHTRRPAYRLYKLQPDLYAH